MSFLENNNLFKDNCPLLYNEKMLGKSKFPIVSIFLLLLVANVFMVSGQVDLVLISKDSQNYDYAVIGKTYNLYVAGSNLQTVAHSQLSTISSSGEVIQYSFNPGNIAGLRTFGIGENQFTVEVLSEAEELAGSIGQITIEVNDKNSTVTIEDFDLSNKIVRFVDVSSISDLSGLGNTKYNLDLNQLLDGLTFNLEFIKNQKYPIYNSLNFQGTASNVLGAVLLYKNLDPLDVQDINSDPSKLNQVIDAYDADVAYPKNAKAVKQGKDFYFYTDEGYANLNSDNITNLQTIIDNKIKLIHPEEIVNLLLPLGNFSEYTSLIDFDISVDTTSLNLEDGTYTLKLLYEDKYGNSGEKPFKVKLDVTNIASPQNVTSNVVNFTDIIIKQTLQSIANLPSNVSNVTAIIFGSVKPSDFPNPGSQVEEVLKYMQINLSEEGISGNFELSFKISKTLISNNEKNYVVLYIREGNNWNALSTSYLNETSTDYLYKAIVPHFSDFMIAIKDTSTSSSGSSYRKTNTTSENQQQNESITNNQGIPLDLNGAGGSEDTSPGFFSITGAAIGEFFRNNPLAIGLITFLIIILAGAYIILRLFRKKPEEEKKEEVKEEKLENKTQDIQEKTAEKKEKRKKRKKKGKKKRGEGRNVE